MHSNILTVFKEIYRVFPSMLLIGTFHMGAQEREGASLAKNQKKSKNFKKNVEIFFKT